MPCKPFMCCGADDCPDRLCEGHPANLTWPEPAEGCELIGPPYALFAAILGIVTVVIGIGGLLWIGYNLAPLFATVH